MYQITERGGVVDLGNGDAAMLAAVAAFAPFGTFDAASKVAMCACLYTVPVRYMISPNFSVIET